MTPHALRLRQPPPRATAALPMTARLLVGAAMALLCSCGTSATGGYGYYVAPDGQAVDGSAAGGGGAEDAGGGSTGADGAATDAATTDTAGDASAGADGGPGDGGPVDGGPVDAGGGTVAVPEVDPQCLDGQYTEPMPNLNASISGPLSSYDSGDVKAFIDGVLGARYPVGQYLVAQALVKGTQIGDCVDFFLPPQARGNPAQVIQQLSVIVHECGHFLDIGVSGFGSSAYVIRPDLVITCSGASYQGTNATFPRSLLNSDEYAPLRPPCSVGGASGDCDSYADIYLDGDPNDGTFDGGDQGFNTVMEEAVQYVNSLATDYAFDDQGGFGSVSARDGILTFLWYMERYLRMARLSYPDQHNFLLGDPCWRQIILTTWGRAWLYLDATDGMNSLGIDDAQLIALVRDPALLEEIDRVRDAEGCP